MLFDRPENEPVTDAQGELADKKKPRAKAGAADAGDSKPCIPQAGELPKLKLPKIRWCY